MTKRMISPEPAQGMTMSGDFWVEIARLRPGPWRVEVAVNGDVEAERAFEVIGSTRAQRSPRQFDSSLAETAGSISMQEAQPPLPRMGLPRALSASLP